MAVQDQVAFTLSRFEWTPPDLLVVAGTWHGVDRSDLSASAVLVLHAPGSTHRLEAVNTGLTRSRNWSARFIWHGDPRAVDRAELEVLNAWVVELPAGKPGQRRLGREILPVRKLDQPRPAAETVFLQSDVSALRAELVKAQDEVADTRDETERVRAHARQERMRHESDVARLHESLSELRQLTDGLLEECASRRRVPGWLKYWQRLRPQRSWSHLS